MLFSPLLRVSNWQTNCGNKYIIFVKGRVIVHKQNYTTIYDTVLRVLVSSYGVRFCTLKKQLHISGTVFYSWVIMVWANEGRLLHG